MSLATASRVTRLQWFARAVIDELWKEVGEFDPERVRYAAIQAGLIVPQLVTEENIEEICSPVELKPGDTYYAFSDDLTDVNWHELEADEIEEASVEITRTEARDTNA